MDYETTLKFINAGYTKEEIENLGAGTEIESEHATDVPKAEPNEAKEVHAGEITRETDPNGEIEALKKSIAELNETIKAIQSDNISKANGGKKPTDSVKEAIDSFIKEF